MSNRLHRAHRSTKIPNAKLRPPPPAAAAGAAAAASAADAEDDAHFRAVRARGTTRGAHTHADFVSAPPLAGTTLCFTGLADEKRELAAIAAQLGAAVEPNLTSGITHLVARKPGSEKYRWAVRFGMHVVSPTWLYAAHDAWLAGDDTLDTPALDEQHRLGALAGFFVALSGIDDEKERAALAAAVAAEGGELAPRLILDGSLTHLCVADARRPLKSLTRVLDHKELARRLGDLELPPSVRAATTIHAVHLEWLHDSLAARAALPEADYDVARPVPSTDARAERVAAIRGPKARAAGGTQQPAPAPPPPASDPAPPPPPRRAPRRSTSALLISREDRFGTHDGVFAGLSFHIDMHDPARTARVASAVKAAGGAVTHGAEANYVVGPLVRTQPASRAPAAAAHVTHHWIERCLYDERIAPLDGVASVPGHGPLPDAHTRCFSTTGLDRDGPDYHHCVAAIAALGARVSDTFRRGHTTHLVVGDGAWGGIKVAKAREWGVEVVTLEWVRDALRLGRWPAQAAPGAPATAASQVVPGAPAPAASQAVLGAPPPASTSPRPDRRLGRTASLPTPAPAFALAASLPPPPSSPPPPEARIMYDDPAARKEQLRLLALVDREPPPKRQRDGA